MNEPSGAPAPPPPMEAIHPSVRDDDEIYSQVAHSAHLSSDALHDEANSVAQMAQYVTDPTQFLLNVPVEKPFTTQVPASLFDECVSVLKRTVQWRVSSTRYNGALPHGRRYAWRKHYVCDHSGKPRDRRNPDLAPGKRRSRRASIKIGCPASFTATQEVGSDTVTLVCRFQHQGHTVNTREYWANSRIPDNVREWIRDRVAEGHDQKEIVQMIHEHQKNAESAPSSNTSFIPPGVQITRMDVYNIIKRFRSSHDRHCVSKHGEVKQKLDHGSVQDANTHRLRLQLGGHSPVSPDLAGQDAAQEDPHAHELDPASASTYPIMSTPASLAPVTPEEAVSFAQQWSDLLVNLQALQPRIMEYALTTGATRHPNTTAEWSQAVAQLTQAWYVASNLLERPVLAHNHVS
ncbi:hypothetical protein MVES1_000429 [Malassezia vespertilionis]|uniref:uncharacterized protein n=1 Tax=Malassezia vespertilionis TaxID=2020962 RepID=UPI0024B0CAE7|nr:uncharacterized protein MVES1_000429 [Malassezia vespertilionis]WFD05103.1 hypothetical protein MVES1_000429 [Malassezia vespertilionis]